MYPENPQEDTAAEDFFVKMLFLTFSGWFGRSQIEPQSKNTNSRIEEYLSRAHFSDQPKLCKSLLSAYNSTFNTDSAHPSDNETTTLLLSPFFRTAFKGEGRGHSHLSVHRRSISVMISSAHRTASDMAATVAGIRFPPSYCASFLAAKIDAAIHNTRLRPSSILGHRGTSRGLHWVINLILPYSPFVRLRSKRLFWGLDDGSSGAGIRTLGCAKIRWANFNGEDGTGGGWEPIRPLGATVAELWLKHFKNTRRDYTSQTGR